MKEAKPYMFLGICIAILYFSLFIYLVIQVIIIWSIKIP